MFGRPKATGWTCIEIGDYICGLCSYSEKPHPTEMTLDEIERELGHKVAIVSNHDCK